MSWAFFLLLVAYGAARLALRLRGNLRYLRARGGDAPPRVAMPTPDHLRGGLAELFAATEALGVVADERRRLLQMLVQVDPDASFGELRDGRFRRASLEFVQGLDRWLRAAEGLVEADRQRAEDLGVTADRIAGERAALSALEGRLWRARALEPFPLDDVRAVQRALDATLDAADHIRARLGGGDAHPYRGVASHPGAAAANIARPALSPRTAPSLEPTPSQEISPIASSAAPRPLTSA